MAVGAVKGGTGEEQMTITKEDLRQIADHVFGHHAAYNSHDGSMGFGRFLWKLSGSVSESAMAFKRVAG
jgi:hypothetical protein